MANTTVGIVFEVYNKGSRNLSALNKDVTTIGRTLKGLAVTTLGLAGIGSIGYALTKTAEGIDRIAKTSDRLGTTTEGLAALEYSASLAGVEVGGLESALEQMTRRAAEAAKGTGEARFAIAALGLDARELATMDPARAIDRVADAMAKVPEHSERVRLTYAIFGRGQSEMVNLLAGGSAALAAQREEADRLGLTFSRIDAAKVEEANDALTRAKATVTAGLRVAVIQMAPYVEALATGLTNAAISGEGFGTKVTAAMEGVAVAAAKVLDILEKIENIKKPIQEAGFTRAFEKDVVQRTNELYEGQIRREGKEPWPSTLFLPTPKRRTSALFPERYDEAEKLVRDSMVADFAKAAKELGYFQPPTDNVQEVEGFFAGIRQRVAEAQTRNTATVAGMGTTAGLPAEDPGKGKELRAYDELLRKMTLERDLAGQTTAERYRAQAVEKARLAAQEDYSRGLRETVDLTAAEVAEVERLDLETRQRAFNEELGTTLDSMRQEADLSRLTAKERERALAVQNAENEALKRGVELSAAQKAELEGVVAQLQRARDLADLTFGAGWSLGIRSMNEELLTTGQIAYDLSRQMRDGIVGSISDAVFRAEDLGEALEQVGLKMLEYWMQEALWKPAVTQGMNLGTQILGGVVGGIFGGGGGGGIGQPGGMTDPGVVGSARGNVFGTQGLIRFARGTVIDAPTVFPFADGTGLMGEEGPEGILPLDRDSHGRLGVHATGAGPAGGGKMEALLGQILTALQQQKEIKFNAQIVDGRDVVTRGQMEGRDGEQWIMYHQARNS